MFLTAERGDGCTPCESRSEKEKCMKSIEIISVMKESGVDLKAHFDSRGHSDDLSSQFFAFDAGNGEKIFVESTTP
ncbi:MAG: hypothetical protein G01um101491_400, partial [Parcubacteria group bacterium Gr01-1014_91]